MSLDEETKKQNADRVMARAIEKSMERVGLDFDSSAVKLKELVDATENKMAYDLILCKWQESPPLAALGIQIKALDMILRLQDAYPADKIKHEITDHVDLEKRLNKALRGDKDKEE